MEVKSVEIKEKIYVLLEDLENKQLLKTGIRLEK